VLLSKAWTCADNTLDADPDIGLTSGYGGKAYNTVWTQDPDVGVVVECSKVLLTSLHCSSLTCPVLCDTTKVQMAGAAGQIAYSDKGLRYA